MMNQTVVEVVKIIYVHYKNIFATRTIDEQEINNNLKDIPEN